MQKEWLDRMTRAVKALDWCVQDMAVEWPGLGETALPHMKELQMLLLEVQQDHSLSDFDQLKQTLDHHDIH